MGDEPIQAASVWDNGVPSLLVDNYQPGKRSIMYRFLQDDKNVYIMSLVYTDGAYTIFSYSVAQHGRIF